ncbi:hypothetical protein FZC33_18820 [Labrys sp. KNU-23]|uniref:hypothetical protein n=1 Tax=Labrys sp. KNU-23 TaxID=2789216 RepID=UPI0011EBA209|nr:hypothetical protein [Labrys sp. KNU-23]QEN88231.1 hypothetical protein FZC33_18820 [Labrys sp. KNU-23]
MCPPLFAAIGAGLASAASAAGSAISGIGLGTAATIAGTGLSAIGAIQQGNAAKAQSDAQAEAYRRQAQIETMTGEYQAGRKQDQVDSTIGTQTALTGGSGVNLDGSPTDVIGSTASEGALDVAAIRWNAKNQTNNLNYQARLANIAGRNAQTGGYLTAAGSLFGGLGRLGKTA